MLKIFLHLHSHLHFILVRITSLTSNKFRNREQVTGEIKVLLEWPLVVNLCCIQKAVNRWSCCIRLKTTLIIQIIMPLLRHNPLGFFPQDRVWQNVEMYKDKKKFLFVSKSVHHATGFMFIEAHTECRNIQFGNIRAPLGIELFDGQFNAV